MPRTKLFFFFLAVGPGFWVVVFLAGTVAAGRLRAGRAVAGGAGVGVVGGAGRGVLGSRLSPDCTMRFIHFSNAVLTKFSSSSSSSTATPGPSAPGSCRRRLVASRSARDSGWVCCTAWAASRLGSANRRFFLAAKCPARFNKALLVNSPLYHCTISGSSFLGNTIISSMTTHTHWPPVAGEGGFFIVFATGGHIDRLPSNPSTTRTPLDSWAMPVDVWWNDAVCPRHAKAFCSVAGGPSEAGSEECGVSRDLTPVHSRRWFDPDWRVVTDAGVVWGWFERRFPKTAVDATGVSSSSATGGGGQTALGGVPGGPTDGA